MRKKKRKNGLLLLFLLLAGMLSLLPGRMAGAKEYFDIQQYHVDVAVSEDNVLSIHETIEANFFEPRHGIYREIPIRNKVRRLDGSQSTVVARISKVSCGSDNFTTSHSGGYYQIKIGDEDRTVSGTHTYQISYQYDMGNDVLKGADEFYYNLVGTEWTVPISNVTFSITMPKEFDESKLGMAQGAFGSTNTEGLSYSIDGRTINGMLDSSIILSPGEGVTVRLELPEGYFVSRNQIPWTAFLSILIAVVTCVLSFLLWNRYGKDDPVVETVEFYPPEDVNSAEAAYLYKGNIPANDVVSLIVYLAQKGYLEIMEVPGGILKKADFMLVKKKDYTGKKESERLFLEGLFKKQNTVGKKDLQDRFYKTINQIVAQLNLQYRHMIFDRTSLNKSWILYVLLAVIHVAATFRPIRDAGYDMTNSIAFVVIGYFCTAVAFRLAFHDWGGKIGVMRVLGGVFCILMGLAFSAPILFTMPLASVGYKAAYGIALLTTAVVGFFAAYMPRRTVYGTKMLGKMRGFKRFLETAEKSRLEAMVEENPQYFYDILPYAYVLGVSDKWMKKFESIAVEPPDWYRGTTSAYFNMHSFHSFMDSTMQSAQSSMTSSPSSSGGGSSGGGSGGGGGGSW